MSTIETTAARAVYTDALTLAVALWRTRKPARPMLLSGVVEQDPAQFRAPGVALCQLKPLVLAVHLATQTTHLLPEQRFMLDRLKNNAGKERRRLALEHLFNSSTLEDALSGVDSSSASWPMDYKGSAPRMDAVHHKIAQVRYLGQLLKPDPQI